MKLKTKAECTPPKPDLTVFRISFNGACIIVDKWSDAMTIVSDDFQELEDGDSVTISAEKMTAAKFEGLSEFTGW